MFKKLTSRKAWILSLAFFLAIIICIQIVKHTDPQAHKRVEAYKTLLQTPTYALEQKPILITFRDYLTEVKEKNNNPYKLTLGSVPRVENIVLPLTLTKDQQVVVVPRQDILQVTNLAQLYPEVLSNITTTAATATIDTPTTATTATVNTATTATVNTATIAATTNQLTSNFSHFNLYQALTLEQLQTLTWYAHPYFKVVTLEKVLQEAAPLNVNLWLVLQEAQQLYLQKNTDLAALTYNLIKNSEITPYRINFVADSTLTLSHLRNDFIRPEKKFYNLVFWIKGGKQLPEVKPDVTYGYTSYVAVANKVWLDESYALAEIDGNYNLINDWYSQLVLAQRPQAFIYAESLTRTSGLAEIYNQLQFSKYKGIVSPFSFKDLYFAP